MSPYVSERTHVRHAIFPALYLRWYRGLLEHTKAEGRHPTEGDRATVAALQEAYGQALDGLDPAKVDRVTRRVERLQISLLRGHEDRALGPVFLIISYALAELLERGLLALVKGSPFDQAYEAIKEAVVVYADDLAGAEKSASKNARRLVEALAREGLIDG
jgi:hypothetical protein